MAKKTSVFILTLGMALLTLAFIPGCGDAEVCETADLPCGDNTLESCCTGDECKYVFSDGHEIACDGTDCSSAAEEAAAYCLQ